MKSRIFSSDSIKVNIKGQIWIPVLLAFGFFMAFPVVSLLQMSSWREVAYTQQQVQMLYNHLWKDGFVLTGSTVMIMAAVMNGINGFWYLYSSRKVDFYHSLPEKRSHMFAKKVLLAFAYTMLPYLIMVFGTICTGIAFGYFSFLIVKLAAGMMAVHICVYFMVYFGTVLVIVLTGNIFMGILSLLGINLFAPVLGNVLNMHRNAFYHHIIPSDFYEGWLTWLSPVGAAVNFSCACNRGITAKECIVYMLLLLVLAAAAYAGYVCRPSEATGKALVYRPSEVVIGYIMTVLVGLSTGILFYVSNYSSGRKFWWIFGIVIGTVLMHGAIQVICNMDFRKFFSRFLWLGASVLSVAAVSGIFKWDLTGFDRYIPAYEKLEDISISFSGSYGDSLISLLEKNENGSYSVYSRPETKKFLEHSSVGLTQEIYDALVQTAQNKRTDEYKDYYKYMIEVRYLEKSGGEVYRKYYPTSQQMKILYESCCMEGSVTEKKYGFLKADASYIHTIRLGTVDGSWPLVYTRGKDDEKIRQDFMAALQADVDEADYTVMMEYPCAKLDIDYVGLPAGYDIDRMIPGKDTTESYNADVYIYPGFKRTVALIKDLGYPLSVDDISAKDISVRYCDPDNGWSYSKDMKYTEEQNRELQKLMHCSFLLPIWTQSDETVDIRVGDAGFVMEESELPEFIREDKQKMRNGELEISEGEALG